MAKGKGLGRGLDALWGDAGMPAPMAAPDSVSSGERVVRIPLGDIDPNRDQPRRHFDEEGLAELAESIKNMGVLQPILVAQTGARYVIIAGERRWRASRMAGLSDIPAIVRDYSHNQRLEAALIENLQRDDLNPVEEAMGIRELIERCGLTQEAAAERLGKSRPAIANILRLLALPETILAMLRDGRLSAGHARALITVPPDTQLKLAQLAAAQGWSVRQLERICSQLQTEDGKKAAPEPARNPELKVLERMAREAFGVKAELSGDEVRGKLTLSYYTADDLQRIWDMLEVIRQSGG